MHYSSFSNLSFQTKNQIFKVQSDMLRTHLAFIKQKSPFYSQKLTNINPDSISMNNLSSLPVTNKQDIEKNPNAFIACKNSEIVDIVHTSGTSGEKIFFKYTEQDMKRLAYNEKQSLQTAGITKNDTVLLVCTMDKCFIAGMAYYSGCRAIGAAVIRIGAAHTEASAELIRKLKPTVIIGVPSYIHKLGRQLQKIENMTAISNVKKLICIGEPLRHYDQNSSFKLVKNPICEKIEDQWQCNAFSTYALTETVTAFCECNSRNGGHLIPELGTVEILDENNNPVPIGQEGEVTLTPFHTTGMPLLRYKTGDIAKLLPNQCDCGRYSLRLGPITGRKFQMLKVKGTKLYPNSIFSILDPMHEIIIYQLIAEKNHLSDTLTLNLALHNPSDCIIENISQTLRAKLRVKINIKLMNEKILRNSVFPNSSRKPIKFKKYPPLK